MAQGGSQFQAVMFGLGLILFLLLPPLSLRTLKLSHLGFWLNLILSMLSSARPGCFFFCRSGHPVVTPDQFLDFVGNLLPQETYLDLPRITGRDLQEVARAKKSTAGGLDGWAWNQIKALAVALVFWSGYSSGLG